MIRKIYIERDQYSRWIAVTVWSGKRTVRFQADTLPQIVYVAERSGFVVHYAATQ